MTTQNLHLKPIETYHNGHRFVIDGAGLIYDRPAHRDIDRGQIQLCETFLAGKRQAKGKNGIGSYNLKHTIECSVGTYISNGACIQAAINLGLPVTPAHHGYSLLNDGQKFYDPAPLNAWIGVNLTPDNLRGRWGFSKWLMRQRKRHGPVGGLAADAFYDVELPNSRSVGVFTRYLENCNACSGARKAFAEAWIEWSQGKLHKFEIIRLALFAYCIDRGSSEGSVGRPPWRFDSSEFGKTLASLYPSARLRPGGPTGREPIGPKLRFLIFERDGFTCRYCGRRPPEVILHVDHIVPVARGGRNCLNNYATSCQKCNQGKGAAVLKDRHGESGPR